MLGEVLLGGAERLLQLADARLALAQPVEQLDAHRFAEHAEALCDQLDEGLGKRMRNGGHVVHVVTVYSLHNSIVDKSYFLSYLPPPLTTIWL